MISETLSLIDEYHVPDDVWVTIGICLRTDHQQILVEAHADGQLVNEGQLFSGAKYVTPQLSKRCMRELVETLWAKEGYTVQVNKLFADS